MSATPPHSSNPHQPAPHAAPADHSADNLNAGQLDKIHPGHDDSPGKLMVTANGEKSRGEIALIQATDTHVHKIHVAEAEHEANRHHYQPVKNARTLASVLSVFPVAGTAAAIAIDGATTLAETGSAIAQGKNFSEIAQTFGQGAMLTGMDVAPGAGLLGKMAMGVGGVGNGGFCQIGSDAVAAVGGPNIICRDYIDEGFKAVTRQISGAYDVPGTGGMPSQSPSPVRVSTNQMPPIPDR